MPGCDRPINFAGTPQQGLGVQIGTMKRRAYAIRAVTNWAILTALLAGGLLLAAGTTRIPTLRAYVAVFSVLLLFTMLAVDPGLAHERAHPQAGGQDARGRFATGFLFLTTVGFAAVDVGRLHESNTVPPMLSVISLIAFAADLSLQIWAMIVNPFFSPVIRIQAARGHHVIMRGPYRSLRHPGYLAMLIAIPASAIAIGSWLALIPAAGFCAVIVRRAGREDEFLKRNLPDFIDYTKHVRGGLFPRATMFRSAVPMLAGRASVAPKPKESEENVIEAG